MQEKIYKNLKNSVGSPVNKIKIFLKTFFYQVQQMLFVNTNNFDSFNIIFISK